MVKSFIILGMFLVSQVSLAQVDSQMNATDQAKATEAANAEQCPPQLVAMVLEDKTHPGQGIEAGNEAGKSAKNDSKVDRMPSQIEEKTVVVAYGNAFPCR